MRTVRRRRDPARPSQLSVVVAVVEGEAIEPENVVMLEGLGACFVLSVRVPDEPPPGLAARERAVALGGEAFALDNEAPDLE
jgi:hypothetical protein